MNIPLLASPLIIVAVLVGFWALASIKILNEYERAVVFRLGRLQPRPYGPGIVLVIVTDCHRAPGKTRSGNEHCRIASVADNFALTE